MTEDLVYYPNNFLRKPTKLVENINEDIIFLIKKMKNILYSERAIGLAANQIGSEYRIFLSDLYNQTLIFINPEIKLDGKDIICEEGCLSLPNLSLQIKRKEKAYVKALNENGKEFELETSDLLSNVIQHEYDHLENILMIDKIPKFELSRILKKYEKYNKKLF